MSDKLEAVERNSFDHGYLIAVSNLISHMGTSTEVEELMAALGVGEERARELDLSEFDLNNLAEYFDAKRERDELNSGEG